MKIVARTLVLHASPDGSIVETPAADPHFRVGNSYEIPELGEGLWTVEEIGEPTTGFAGGYAVATTRVKVAAAAPGSVATLPTEALAKSGGTFVSAPSKGPVQKPGRKPRHTPR